MALNVLATGIEFTPQGGSSVNLLDDYEEGTWTPTIHGSGFTYTAGGADGGTYRKMGALVWVGAHTDGSLSSGSGTAAVRYIGSLPFAKPGGNSSNIQTGMSFGLYHNNSGQYGTLGGNGAPTSNNSSNHLFYGSYTTNHDYFFDFTYPVDS